jgi:copper(I)-binding protein
MHTSIRKLGLAIALTFMPFAVMANTADKEVNITKAFAPETAPTQKMGAVYFNMTNNGTVPHTIISMTSTNAEQVQLHKNEMTGGKNHMSPIEKLEILPHATQTLTPAGTHVMLLNIKQPLKAGDHVQLTVMFDDGSKTDLSVPVEKEHH